MTRRLKASAYAGFKAATAALIERGFGGQRIAAEATRVGQQALSDYASRAPRQAEIFMPIDVLADLTEASGDTGLLRALAEQANCLLVPLPVGEPNDAVDERMIRSAKDYADLVGALIEAKRSGTIARADVPRVLADVRDLMLELAALAEAVKQAATEGKR